MKNVSLPTRLNLPWLAEWQGNFRRRYRSWFAKRMPQGDRVELTNRSTYIFPTKAGFLLIGVVFLMLLGATNYQNNLAFMLTFLITAIGLVSILYTYKNLQGLIFEREATAPVFAGETIELVVDAYRDNAQPAAFITASFQDETGVVFDYDGQSPTRFTLSLATNHRGWQALPPVRVSSEFPFGLLRAWSWFRFASPVLVYPKPIEPPQGRHQAGDSEQDEGHPVKGSEELYGVRPYQPGDPMSRIDWKSFAREGGLNTRDFVAYHQQSLCFDWRDFRQFDYESTLSYLTWLVIDAASKELPWSLVLPDNKLPLDDGPKHFEDSMKALALSRLEKRGM